MDIPKLRGLELQIRTRSKVSKTNEGRALTFGFKFGPLAFFAIVNMPELTGPYALSPLVFVKVTMADDSEEWEIFKDHGCGHGPINE